MLKAKPLGRSVLKVEPEGRNVLKAEAEGWSVRDDRREEPAAACYHAFVTIWAGGAGSPAGVALYWHGRS